MNKNLAEKIAEYSHGDVEVLEEYSGRGMYGKTTTALTADSLSSILVGVVYAAASIAESEFYEEDIEEDCTIDDLAEFAEDMSQDSLGLGIVIY